MPKSRYLIEVETLDRSVCPPLPISRAEFTTRIRWLKSQAKTDRLALPKDNEIEEQPKREFSNDTVKQTMHIFRCGTTHIILTEIHAKDGYKLLPLKELR